MTRARILRTGATLAAAGAMALAALAMVVGDSGRAGAVTALEVGSWWQGQPPSGGAPPPPQVAKGGIWVSGGPAGPLAVSALRLTLEAGESAPVLTVAVAELTPPSSVLPPQIVACPAAGSWKPATAGAWSDRPQANCAAGSVAGRLSMTGDAIGFDLTPLLSGSQVDVVFVPGATTPPVSGLPIQSVPSSFDMATKAVTTSSVNVRTEPVETPLAATGAVVPAAPSGDVAPSDVTVPDLTAGSLEGSQPPATAPPAVAAPAPQAPVAAAPLTARPASATRASSRTVRLFGALVLLALAAWWWWLASRPAGAGRRMTLAGPAGDAPPALRARFPHGAGRPPALR